jgi:uncharacterized protein YbjT (DUF2867 family)
MKLLLLGASGLVGRHVLAQALAHPAVSSVVAPTRQPLTPHPNLTNPVADNLASLLAEGVARGVDAIICTLGTTIGNAGSKEAFREVDYTLPLEFARSARKSGTQTFVLVSASVASVRSTFFYPRVKGEVERDIALAGFRSLTIVRPSLIGGEREKPRFGEGIAVRVMNLLAPILPRKLHVNPAPAIAAACLSAATEAKPGCHFRNARACSDATGLTRRASSSSPQAAPQPVPAPPPALNGAPDSMSSAKECSPAAEPAPASAVPSRCEPGPPPGADLR